MYKLRKTTQKHKKKKIKKSPLEIKNSNRKIKKNDFLIELKQGSTIEVIAPASGAPVEHLLEGVRALENAGFKVIYDAQILKPEIFLAQTDEYRFRQLKRALLNPKSDAVWCLRGGYGSLRLLPQLEKMSRPKKAKLLIGLSDITSLQTFISLKWGWPTLHTSMIDRFGMKRVTEQNQKEILRSLTDSSFEMEFANLIPLNSTALKKKIIRSQVIGGNLVVLTSSLGTPFQIKPQGYILFLEELGERAYRVDRCLQQLKQAGVFRNVKAIVFGDFTNCSEPNGENYILQTLTNFCAGLSIPAFRGIENGHGELQRPLFFNTSSVLECAGSKSKLKVKSPLRKA